jgi:ASC-1-like (ASCH) protein
MKTIHTVLVVMALVGMFVEWSSRSLIYEDSYREHTAQQIVQIQRRTIDAQDSMIHSLQDRVKVEVEDLRTSERAEAMLMRRNFELAEWNAQLRSRLDRVEADLKSTTHTYPKDGGSGTFEQLCVTNCSLSVPAVMTTSRLVGR